MPQGVPQYGTLRPRLDLSWAGRRMRSQSPSRMSLSSSPASAIRRRTARTGGTENVMNPMPWRPLASTTNWGSSGALAASWERQATSLGRA